MHPTSITGQSILCFLISSLKALRTSKDPAARPHVAAPTIITGLFSLSSRRCASARALISRKAAFAADRSLAFTFFFSLGYVVLPEGNQDAVHSGRFHF